MSHDGKKLLLFHAWDMRSAPAACGLLGCAIDGEDQGSLLKLIGYAWIIFDMNNRISGPKFVAMQRIRLT
jgi:hypothetical protein